jgi:hypothetical protein
LLFIFSIQQGKNNLQASDIQEKMPSFFHKKKSLLTSASVGIAGEKTPKANTKPRNSMAQPHLS